MKILRPIEISDGHRATQLLEEPEFEPRSAKVDLETSVLPTRVCRALNKKVLAPFLV